MEVRCRYKKFHVLRVKIPRGAFYAFECIGFNLSQHKMRVKTGCVVVVVLRCVFRELTSCPDQGPEGGGRKSIDRYERPLTSTGTEHYSTEHSRQ